MIQSGLAPEELGFQWFNAFYGCRKWQLSQETRDPIQMLIVH